MCTKMSNILILRPQKWPHTSEYHLTKEVLWIKDEELEYV